MENGNMCSIGLENLFFKKVHVHLGSFDDCLTITSWQNHPVGVRVNSKEFGSLFLSEGTYLLCENECPICSKKGLKSELK